MFHLIQFQKGEVDNQDKKILRPPPPDPSKIRAFLKSKEEKQNSQTELKQKRAYLSIYYNLQNLHDAKADDFFAKLN